jgi:hypothetical protein
VSKRWEDLSKDPPQAFALNSFPSEDALWPVCCLRMYGFVGCIIGFPTSVKLCGVMQGTPTHSDSGISSVLRTWLIGFPSLACNGIGTTSAPPMAPEAHTFCSLESPSAPSWSARRDARSFKTEGISTVLGKVECD